MACLDISQGFFSTGLLWSTSGGTTTPNGATLTTSSTGISVQKGASSRLVSKPPSGAVYWMNFGSPANFLLVLSLSDVTPDIAATRTVVLVDTTTPGLPTKILGTIVAKTTDELPQVQPSLGNGNVFALLLSAGGNLTATIFRSDTGDSLCSVGPFVPGGTVSGHATPTDLQIVEGVATVLKSVPLPAGTCQVTPPSLSFPAPVLGASNPALATQTLQATIRNAGNDCLTVTSIGNLAPFSVVATSLPLPTTLAVGAMMTADIQFAPTTTDSYVLDLPMSHTPAAGDTVISCRGQARDATHSIAFPGALAFGTVPVGTSATRTLALANNGEAIVHLVVPASPPGSDFQWAAASASVTPGGPALPVAITFAPTSETPQTWTITFTSDAAGSPHHVALTGTGCVARARIAVDAPVGPVDFGSVQRGFRSVRTVQVENLGNGPLTFRASVAGSPLFGLARAGDSVTSPATSLDFAVDPATACGSGTTGSGAVVFGVVFFANDLPAASPVLGQLVVDQHNDAAAPASFSFALTASIVDAVGTDTMLVVDRSGSMADASGDRRKIDTAVDAGQLYVELGRPDVGDRIGLTKFNDTPQTYLSISEITSANQGTIAGLVNLTELAPMGSTAIAGGVLDALRNLRDNPRAAPPPDLNRTLVVLTDAMDNTPYDDPDDGVTYTLLGDPGTTALPVAPDVKIYGIGIGDSIDVARLGQLAQATGGQYLHVLEFTGADYFALEKHFTQIYMDSVDLATIHDPIYSIAPGETQTIEFVILRGDVSCMVVVYDRDGIRIPFDLRTPQNEIVELATVPSGFAVRPGITATARFLEVRFPLDEPDRFAGTWTVSVRHDGRACSAPGGLKDRSAFQFGYQPTRCVDHRLPIPYGIAVGAGSNFRLEAHVDPAVVRVGESLRLNALVSEFGLPVTGAAVTAKVRTPSGRTETLVLHDDSDLGDYAGRFTHTFAEGTYELTFTVKGRSLDGEPARRETVRSKYLQGRTPLVPTSPTGPAASGKATGPCEPSGGDSKPRKLGDGCVPILLGLGVLTFLVVLILLVLWLSRP